ncbi:MAG TPA: cation diffusion facilitator family transporter [Bacteroidales bacterium]|nr:cation transporter [Lentimicrobiaceae bacterium]HOH99531.1 cation diffusion facilitator family transporter [Bacteroidales bacterium]
MSKAEPRRADYLRKAALVGIAGNAILAGLKIIAGIVAGSYAVIGDGLDSLADVVTFLITLIAARVTARPADLKYTYGYQKAESIATKALSFVIFFGGVQFIIAAVNRLMDAQAHTMPGYLALVATVASIIGKWVLSKWQHRLGKQSGSELLIANARNMQNDILISFSVLIGLGLTYYFQQPLVDLILALLVGLWIIRVAYQIFMEANLELMDGIRDPDVYFKIFRAMETVPEATNPHRIKVREFAGKYLIAMDIEVAPSLNIEEGHRIALKLEQAIKEEIPMVHDILIHIEPFGNDEKEEAGITPREVHEAYKGKQK